MEQPHKQYRPSVCRPVVSLRPPMHLAVLLDEARHSS